MVKSIFTGLAVVAAHRLDNLAPVSFIRDADQNMHVNLFEKLPTNTLTGETISADHLQETFLQVWNQMMDGFDVDTHEKVNDLSMMSSISFLQSRASTGAGYTTLPGGAQCDLGEGNAQSVANGVSLSAFPGGITKRVGFSMAGLLSKLSQASTGPASVNSGVASILASQALQQGMGIIQAVVADALHIIPPMIAPPAWNNQPLPCVPMVAGKNCLGAVLHPITAADMAVASTTDAALDGVVAGFPSLYAAKVGKTSNSQYKTCFSAYMSMHCASSFPRCMAPQSGNDMTTNSPQRLPLCFTQCIATLVACPGLWIDDISDVCQDVSVPPMCSQAFFWNLNLLAPQYSTFEENNAATSCPSVNPNGFDIGKSLDVYEKGARSAPH